MRHRAILVQGGQRGAGDERSEDRLEAETVHDRREPDQQHERAADADLRCRVLKPLQRGRDAARVFRDDDGDDDRGREHREAPEQDQLRAHAG